MILLSLWLALPTWAQTPLPFTTQHGLAPMNSVIFCRKYPADCRVSAPSGAQTRAQLESVNRAVNAAITGDLQKVGRPGIDPWLLSPPTGNCADYAVTKRHALLALGWGSADLILATVTGATIGGHVVLIVRTASENVVLDSLRPDIVSVTKTPYDWIEIQDSTNPNYWLNVLDGPEPELN